MRGLLGFAALLGIAVLLSEDRRRIPLRPVLAGVALQAALAAALMRVGPVRAALLALNGAAASLQDAADAGSSFLFGYLGGGPVPFAETHPGASFILAFRALPLVLVISALAALLFHWGVLQRVTRALAWVLRRSLGISGALALGAAVHVFVGMVEAPLLIRPYLARLQRGEIFALMSVGLAGIAGTVMAIYAVILTPVIPESLGTIVAAALVSTPGALAVAAIMVPFTPGDTTDGDIVLPHRDGKIVLSHGAEGAIGAVVQGTLDGVPILVGIAALLLVTVALVHLANAALGLFPFPGGALSLQRIFAWPFRPVMWLVGVPWAESAAAARLMATKTVLNEFVAYLDLAHMPPAALSARTRLILVYALCGFANFGSLGIMVGGLTAMVPERRAEVASLGLRAVLAGTLATCMSGALAGLLAPG